MSASPPSQFECILLLGPTGSGKTPLGDWLEAHGLAGRRCHHFDFGANLRAAVSLGRYRGFTSAEVDFLKQVLAEGLLLENESFAIAEKILDTFVQGRGVHADDWLILNGLPRHIGQAEALESRLRVLALVELVCDAEAVRARLRVNSGGDRGERVDDTQALVVRKLATYAERTRPLSEHYQQRGTRLIQVPVGVRTTPGEIAEKVGPLIGAHRR